VTLFLLQRQVLSAPVLYISYSLKKNRTEYYDRLMLVREKGDYEQWVQFFLTAIRESADDAIETVDKLVELREKNMTLIYGMGRSAKTLQKLFNYLEANPIVEIQKTAIALGSSFNTISDAIKRLCELGILEQASGIRRNRTFNYGAYLDILRSGT
jgi:Fic family protein